MDQFTSVLAREGEALLLDCRTREARPVALQSNEVTFLVVNTQVRHRLAESQYPLRRAQCEQAAKSLGIPALRDATLPMLEAQAATLDPVVFRRARHVISENSRVLEFAKALESGDWQHLGELMYQSHESLQTDFEVSCRELDIVVNIARKLGTAGGVFGCRMTGGGFGGCAIALVRTDAIKLLTRKIAEAYEEQTNSQAAIFSTHPAGGARVIS
jgi:galactokinase